MSKSGVLFLLLLCAISYGDDPVPFWKAKPEVYRKMKEERYIPVSAHVEKSNDEKKLAVMSAGIIHAPVDFTHDKILEFKKYPDFVPYVLDCSYDPKTSNIFVHGAFLAYHVHMTVHYDTDKTLKGHKIRWKSIEGGFVGMTGTITEEPIDDQHTEISMQSLYQSKNLGIPAFLLDWGLEFSAQRMSNAMRSHVESEWEASKKQKKVDSKGLTSQYTKR